MNPIRKNVVAAAFAVAGLAGVVAPPAVASNVAWSVSVGVPGFGVNAGQPAFGPSYGPGFRPVVVRSFGYRPVMVARPVFVSAPPVYFAPRPVFASRVVVAPPVYFTPRPVYAPRVVVVPRSYVGVTSFPSPHWYY